MSITITEALAEIKTIQKRIGKKQESIGQFLSRQEGIKDPMEKHGGSAKFVAEEAQAIRDLEARIIALRRGIQRANDETSVTIREVTRTISEWLTWRREIAPVRQQWLNRLRQALGQVRVQAQRGGSAIIQANASAGGEVKPTDYIVNIDEKGLAEEIEGIEATLGELDGVLSLKNATIQIKE